MSESETKQADPIKGAGPNHLLIPSFCVTMRTSTLFFLWIVVCGLEQAESSGSVGGGSEKCLCKGKLLKAVKNKLIQVGPVVHPKSIFCTKIEIIFTLKTEIKKCLDPNSRQGKRLINRFIHGNQGQTNQQRRPKTNKRRKQRRKTVFFTKGLF